MSSGAIRIGCEFCNSQIPPLCNGLGLIELFEKEKNDQQMLADEMRIPLEELQEQFGKTSLKQLRAEICTSENPSGRSRCRAFNAFLSGDPHSITPYKR